jgi:hypothetical protein
LKKAQSLKGKSKVAIGPTTFSFDTTEAGTFEGAAEFVETDVTAMPRDHIQLQQLFQFSVMLSKNTTSVGPKSSDEYTRGLRYKFRKL